MKPLLYGICLFPKSGYSQINYDYLSFIIRESVVDTFEIREREIGCNNVLDDRIELV